MVQAARNIFAIFKKETRILFTTPIAYIALSVFVFTSGFFFIRFLTGFQQQIIRFTQRQPQMLEYLNFTDHILQPLFFNVAIILTFVVALVTMRSIAEERKSNTFELLLTTPVTSFQITVGKYLASVLIIVCMAAILVVYPFLVSLYAKSGGPEWNTVFSGMLGILLLGSAFTAIGLCVSSFTNSQLTAAIITFFILLMLWTMGMAARDNSGLTRDVLSGISASDHLIGFTEGRIYLKDVIYFVSLIFLGIFLTQRILEAQRWQD
jgi:ABC-2 type transport system permease protein